MDQLDKLKLSIRKQVEEKNLTISKFEREAGLKPGSVYNILNGRSQKPSLELILAISNSLGCSVEELLIDAQEEIPLDTTLSKEIILACLEEFESNTLSFKDFIKYIAKIYNFCYIDNNKKFDRSIVKYIVKVENIEQ